MIEHVVGIQNVFYVIHRMNLDEKVLIANVETSIPAKFRVKLNKFPYMYDRSVLDYVTLNIGSEKYSCVDITIPVRDKSEPLYLDHITASKPGSPCSIDNTIIKGPKTKQMFYFAASLLSKLTDKTLIEFTDQSHYPCSITNTETRNMPLNISYFMFHGKTWYDELFGAKPKEISVQEKYKLLQARRSDPAFKPKNFRFKSNPLADALAHLYAQTQTWEEFFKLIEQKYGKDKCKMVYMWMGDVLALLVAGNNDIFGINERWVIDISHFPYIYHTPLKVYGGGAKTRRKTRKHDLEIYHEPRDVMPSSRDFAIFSNPANIPIPHLRTV